MPIVLWQDKTVGGTPLNAANLNNMQLALKAMAQPRPLTDLTPANGATVTIDWGGASGDIFYTQATMLIGSSVTIVFTNVIAGASLSLITRTVNASAPTITWPSSTTLWWERPDGTPAIPTHTSSNGTLTKYDAWSFVGHNMGSGVRAIGSKWQTDLG